MTTMVKVKAFPTLYGKASTGKIKVWKIEVKEKGNEYHITSTHGYEGMKMAVSKPVIVTKGKNIEKMRLLLKNRLFLMLKVNGIKKIKQVMKLLNLYLNKHN